MRAMIVGAILLNGCAPCTDGIYITDTGPYDRSDMEAVIDETIDLLEAHGFEGFRSKIARSDIELRIVPNKIQCAGTELVNGCTEPGIRVSLVSVHSVFGCTYIAHEFVHLALQGDKSHSTPGDWYKNDKEDSVEFAIFDRICNDEVKRLREESAL